MASERVVESLTPLEHIDAKVWTGVETLTNDEQKIKQCPGFTVTCVWSVVPILLCMVPCAVRIRI